MTEQIKYLYRILVSTSKAPFSPLLKKALMNETDNPLYHDIGNGRLIFKATEEIALKVVEELETLKRKKRINHDFYRLEKIL